MKRLFDRMKFVRLRNRAETLCKSGVSSISRLVYGRLIRLAMREILSSYWIKRPYKTVLWPVALMNAGRVSCSPQYPMLNKAFVHNQYATSAPDVTRILRHKKTPSAFDASRTIECQVAFRKAFFFGCSITSSDRLIYDACFSLYSSFFLFLEKNSPFYVSL